MALHSQATRPSPRIAGSPTTPPTGRGGHTPRWDDPATWRAYIEDAVERLGESMVGFALGGLPRLAILSAPARAAWEDVFASPDSETVPARTWQFASQGDLPAGRRAGLRPSCSETRTSRRLASDTDLAATRPWSVRPFYLPVSRFAQRANRTSSPTPSISAGASSVQSSTRPVPARGQTPSYRQRSALRRQASALAASSLRPLRATAVFRGSRNGPASCDMLCAC